MSDSTSNPNPNPNPNPGPDQPPAKATRAPRSQVNKEFTAALTKARAVAAAAVDPDLKPRLDYVQLDATLPGKINTLADTLELNVGQLVGLRGQKGGMTKEEKAARDELIAILQPIQIASTRVPTDDPTGLRAAYFIGAQPPLSSQSLDDVVLAARAIRARLIPGKDNAPPQDTLPGINPEPEIKELSDAIAAYVAKNKAQGELETKGEGNLEQANADKKQLLAWTHEIQTAADQAWPWRKPGVKTIRKRFELPESQPLGE